jgi:outer membrane murein-binding lipoprotein Lpp
MSPLYLTAQAGVTLTPALLALLGMLVAALGALLGGGVAWGRFAATLDQLRADHADLRVEVRKGQADGTQIAVLCQRSSDLESEVKGLRAKTHELGTAITRLTTQHDALASRVGTLHDDVRASHHPSPR